MALIPQQQQQHDKPISKNDTESSRSLMMMDVNDEGVFFDCSLFRVGSTDFNFDSRLRPRAGIMFDLQSSTRRGLVLQTLELDVQHWDELTDRSVQVFVSNSLSARATDIYSQPHAWTKIADSVLTMAHPDERSDSSVIIPAYDFRATAFAPGVRRAVYVRLGGGAHLESTFDPAVGIGDPARVVGDHQDWTVHGGLAIDDRLDLFPEDPDTATAPIFAGRLLYQAEEDSHSCVQDPHHSVRTTSVELRFVVDQVVTGRLQLAVEEAVEEVVVHLLETDQNLLDLQQQAGLTLTGNEAEPLLSVSTPPGLCPRGDTNCFVLQAAMTFQHAITLSSGRVRRFLYQQVDRITARVTNALASMEFSSISVTELQPVSAVYVGLQNVQSHFQMVLTGVDRGQKMDSVMGNFFIQALVDAMNNGLPGYWTEVHDVLVSQQFPLQPQQGHQRGRNLKGSAGRSADQEQQGERQTQQTTMEKGSIRLEGVVYGAIQVTTLDLERMFAERVHNAVLTTRNDMETKIKYDILLPGPMAEGGRYIFFQEMKLSDSLFQPFPSDSPLSSSGSDANDDFIVQIQQTAKEAAQENEDALFIAGLTASLVLLLCCLACCIQKFCRRPEKS